MIKNPKQNEIIEAEIAHLLNNDEVQFDFDIYPKGNTLAYVHIGIGPLLMSGFRIMESQIHVNWKHDRLNLVPPLIPGSKSTKLTVIHFANKDMWKMLDYKAIEAYKKRIKEISTT